MTIGTNNRNDATGNGAVDTYSYTFKIFAATDLRVTVRDTDGVETELTYPTHYTVSGVGAAAGGSVALVNGAFDWLDVDGDLDDGYAITIRRVRPVTQTTDIRNQTQVFNDVLEDTFDHLVMIDQQQQDEIDRSLKLPETDGSSTTLLPAASERALKGLVFDADGNPTMSAALYDITAALAAADADAAAAAASAAASAASAAASATSATAAQTAEANAETAEANSETALAATEVARDAALAAARIYADTTAGLAAVASGEYFYVPSSLAYESLILYKDNAGVAVEVRRYISTDILTENLPPGYAWVKHDGTYAAIGMLEDGTFKAEDAEITNLTVATINNEAPGSTIARAGGTYPFERTFFICTGQSLAEGSKPIGGGLTTVQEYDNIGFPAVTTSPSAFVTATVANTERVSGANHAGEWPGLGFMGFLKELIEKENGIDYTVHNYQLAAANHGYGGYSITQLFQGTSPYNIALSQVTSGKTISDTDGKTFGVGAVTWDQGESDTALAKDTYKNALIDLAEDYNTDIKAITGQTQDVRFISYQIASVGFDIARAQLEASQESPLITVSCPMYQFTYIDTMHVDETSTKWRGAYHALAHKRIVNDGKEFQPLQPVAHSVQYAAGGVIDLIFNKTGLVLDTTSLPAQTNYGFSVKNSGGVAQSISSVALLSPNRVRITMNAVTPAPGWYVEYGNNAMSGRADAFIGSGGNLRDSQGDTLTYDEIAKPMHNWCVLFRYTI